MDPAGVAKICPFWRCAGRPAATGKLDAAWSKRLYRIIQAKQYTKVKRKPGYKLAPITDPTKPEPGLYRAEQL